MELWMLYPAGFAVAVLGGWIWRYASGQGTHLGPEPSASSWEIAGEELGLRFRKGERSASLAGDLEGVRVYADAEWAPADGDRRREPLGLRTPVGSWTVRTRLRALLPPGMPAGLRLREQTALSALAGSLRSDGEIVLGDAEFDRAFLIQGRDPEAVARALTPAVRVGLLVLAGKGILTMDGTELVLVLPELSDIDRLGLLLGAMAGVVRALS